MVVANSDEEPFDKLRVLSESKYNPTESGTETILAIGYPLSPSRAIADAQFRNQKFFKFLNEIGKR